LRRTQEYWYTDDFQTQLHLHPFPIIRNVLVVTRMNVNAPYAEVLTSAPPLNNTQTFTPLTFPAINSPIFSFLSFISILIHTIYSIHTIYNIPNTLPHQPSTSKVSKTQQQITKMPYIGQIMMWCCYCAYRGRYIDGGRCPACKHKAERGSDGEWCCVYSRPGPGR
jgi:hypothetical protein